MTVGIDISQTMHQLSLKIFLFLIFLLVFFFLLTSRTGLLFGIRSFTVMSGSMEPKLPAGSIVISSPANSYSIGDVITFKRGATSITHRIVWTKSGFYQTKGDANDTPDTKFVSHGLVIGRVSLVIPFLGRIFIFIKTIPGFFIFIALPTIFFVFIEVKEIKTEFEREIEKKLLQKLQGFEKL